MALSIVLNVFYIIFKIVFQKKPGNHFTDLVCRVNMITAFLRDETVISTLALTLMVSFDPVILTAFPFNCFFLEKIHSMPQL